MDTFDPNNAIVPIVKVSENDPIKEILGTGSFIGIGEDICILTAKHIFEMNEIEEKEKYGFVFNNGKGIGVWTIQKIVVSQDYDIALCSVEYVDGMLPLPFCKSQPSLITDIYCYEYSTTSIERKPMGRKHISFQPLSHKGNIMRYFDSEFPEKIKTPSFNTSFPALQGASGAPILSSTKNKNFYIAGIMVANQETHLLPAQVVEIIDGDNFLEQTSYYLPMGKAINASLVTKIIEGLGFKIEYVE